MRNGSGWRLCLPRAERACAKHGYTCVHANGRQLPNWSKGPAFRESAGGAATLNDPRFDAVLYLDDDTVLCNDELMVESFLGSPQGVIMAQHDHPKRLKGKRPWWTATPNTGVVIYRSTQWVKRLLNDMPTSQRCKPFWKSPRKQHDRFSKCSLHAGPMGKCHDQCCLPFSLRSANTG